MIGSLPSNIGRGLNNKKPLDKHRSIRRRTRSSFGAFSLQPHFTPRAEAAGCRNPSGILITTSHSKVGN